MRERADLPSEIRASDRLVLRLLPALLWALTWAGPLPALDPGRPIHHFHHDHWQTDDGLPQSTITAIRQTPDGYLWLGT